MADLVSVAEVRAFIQKPDPDTDQDAILGALISRASDAIMRYTEREFAPATSSPEERKFEVDSSDWGNAFLSLAPYDLRGVPTLVKFDTDLSSPYTLSTAEYRVFPRPTKYGVYTALRLRPQGSGTSNWFPDVREVGVTGQWGFATVPDQVKHACCVTVADWYRLNVAAFSTTFNIDTGSLDVPQSFPKGVVPVLDSFRRYTF